MAFEDLKISVEALSGGKNTVKYDDLGYPSIMVTWPKQKNSALIDGGSDAVHYGSIVNEVEKTMYISKFQNVVKNGHAYSLPMEDPAANLNFDAALQYCRANGKGWGLMPFSLWAEVALWCRKNGTMPRGNNASGKDTSAAYEAGVLTKDSSTGIYRTATGSGPNTWNHNWLPDGISDLNGNVSEWTAGTRLNGGEINIIKDANVMDQDVSLAASSDAWKAINASGELVDVGTSGTLKYDWISSKITLTTDAVSFTTDQGNYTEYKSVAAKSGLTIPEIAKLLLLYPDDTSGDYGGDGHYMNTTGERLAYCGGSWGNGSSAGVFCVYLSDPRSNVNRYLGFRSAFCEL